MRSGKTFSYGQNGFQGLLENKKVVVVTARAGAYRPGLRPRKLISRSRT
jgi:FMN-dependent NADH-azoreductase